jgi:hypothetical protein
VDRSAEMPRRAWVEIRDEGGELLEQIPATIAGGGIQAEIPGFPPNTRGTIHLLTEPDEGFEEPQLQELPTAPQLLIVQVG